MNIKTFLGGYHEYRMEKRRDPQTANGRRTRQRCCSSKHPGTRRRGIRQAEQVVSDVYDKTTQKVSETYEKAKSYSNENQGKTILIALGIGVGLGLLLGAGTRRSSSRFVQPVVHALSDIASEIFR